MRLLTGSTSIVLENSGRDIQKTAEEHEEMPHDEREENQSVVGSSKLLILFFTYSKVKKRTALVRPERKSVTLRPLR